MSHIEQTKNKGTSVEGWDEKTNHEQFFFFNHSGNTRPCSSVGHGVAGGCVCGIALSPTGGHLWWWGTRCVAQRLV